MAKAKYIIGFFLFLTAFLLTGESYTYFLGNFQDTYTQIGYFLPTGADEKEMNRHIADQASAFDATVFALETTSQGVFSRTITVYADGEAENILQKDWNIEAGTVTSFFSGKTCFLFRPFEEAGEKVLQNCWYPDKSRQELYDMVYPGMVFYSGAFRHDPLTRTSRQLIAGIWLIVLLAVSLLTLYDISYGRREQAIRLILGFDNQTMTYRKMGKDLIGFSISALLAFLLLTPFTRPAFEWPTTLVSFALLLLTNTVLILWGMRVKRSQPLHRELSHKVLRFSMVLKGLTAVLAIVILSLTLGLSIASAKLHSQKNYYISRNHMVHADISYPYDYEHMEFFTGSAEGLPPLNTMDQLQDNFLRYSYKYLSCSLLYSYSYKEIAPKYGDKYIFANLKGLSSYRERIPHWDELCSEEGTYLLVPDTAKPAEVEAEFLSFASLLGLSQDDLAGVLTYQSGLSLVGEGRRDGEYDYSYRTKNPIIILDTYDYGKLPLYPVSLSLRRPDPVTGIIYKNAPFLMQFISLADEPDRIHAFADACAGEAINPALMEFSIENVEDWFTGLWKLQSRSLLVSVILILLLLVLEVQVTALVLRILYRTHAKEVTIKKVFGYSVLERYREFFLLSGLLCALSLAASSLLFLFLKIGIIRYMLYGSLIVWLLDWTILVMLTKKHERLEIQRVLKGGI